MSCTPGKVAIDGVTEVAGRELLGLHYVQARDPDLADRPFFAELDVDATWLDQLVPAFEEQRMLFGTESRI